MFRGMVTDPGDDVAVLVAARYLSAFSVMKPSFVEVGGVYQLRGHREVMAMLVTRPVSTARTPRSRPTVGTSGSLPL